jgi:hypothetical protein
MRGCPALGIGQTVVQIIFEPIQTEAEVVNLILEEQRIVGLPFLNAGDLRFNRRNLVAEGEDTEPHLRPEKQDNPLDQRHQPQDQPPRRISGEMVVFTHSDLPSRRKDQHEPAPALAATPARDPRASSSPSTAETPVATIATRARAVGAATAATCVDQRLFALEPWLSVPATGQAAREENRAHRIEHFTAVKITIGRAGPCPTASATERES